MKISNKVYWKYGVFLFWGTLALLVTSTPLVSSTNLYKPVTYSLILLLLLGFAVTWCYGVIWSIEHFKEFHIIKGLSLVVFCVLFSAMAGTIVYARRESLVGEIKKI